MARPRSKAQHLPRTSGARAQPAGQEPPQTKSATQGAAGEGAAGSGRARGRSGRSARAPERVGRGAAGRAAKAEPAARAASVAPPAAAAAAEVAPVGAWLMKSEPEVFSYADLLASPGRRTGWDGVRNYQARNFMRDRMRSGDLVLFYHSNSQPPALVGLARVVGAARPDPTQFDPQSEHFDPDSDPAAPRWLEVEIEAQGALPRAVSLDELRAEPRLAGLQLLARGNRLSVLPVSPVHLQAILDLAQATPSSPTKSQKSAKSGPRRASAPSSRAPKGPVGGDKT